MNSVSSRAEDVLGETNTSGIDLPVHSECRNVAERFIPRNLFGKLKCQFGHY